MAVPVFEVGTVKKIIVGFVLFIVALVAGGVWAVHAMITTMGF